MYSVVLMAAMTTTAEAPGFGAFWSKHCFWDSCYPARYGWVNCGPGHRPYYPAPYWSCHGCGGCWSAGHGCGGWGWHHGCYGHTCYGCYGGHFAHAGIYAGIGYQGFGAYGNFGMYGSIPVHGAPMYATPITQDGQRAGERSPFETLPVRPKAVEEVKPPEKKSGSLPPLPSDTKAAVVVKVPAGAKVYIDGNLMKSTSAERTFTSPPLEPGESYYYTLRVVTEKDGKEVEDVRRVSVRAGEVSRLSFDSLFDRVRPDDRTIVEVTPRPQR